MEKVSIQQRRKDKPDSETKQAQTSKMYFFNCKEKIFSFFSFWYIYNNP